MLLHECSWSHAAGAIVVTTLELPITRADKIVKSFIFEFPANSTSWGGPLQGIVYGVSESTEKARMLDRARALRLQGKDYESDE